MKKISLASIWQNQHKNNTKKFSVVAKERCNDREAKFIFDDGRDNFAGFLPKHETRGMRNNMEKGVLQMEEMV